MAHTLAHMIRHLAHRAEVGSATLTAHSDSLCCLFNRELRRKSPFNYYVKTMCPFVRPIVLRKKYTGKQRGFFCGKYRASVVLSLVVTGLLKINIKAERECSNVLLHSAFV